MSAVERIQAAIDKLRMLEAASAPGPWSSRRDDEKLGWFVDGGYGPVVTTGYVGNSDSQPHADLIASLYQTIEPQLDLLHLAIEYGPLAEGQGSRFWRAAVALTNAILGAEPNPEEN